MANPPTDRRFYNRGRGTRPGDRHSWLSKTKLGHAWSCVRTIAARVGGFDELAKVSGMAICTIKQWRFRAMGQRAALRLEQLSDKFDLGFSRTDFRPDNWPPPKPQPVEVMGQRIDCYN